jgi:hypothetical protein
MFCPNCGQEDRDSQFCRACGTELSIIRTALQTPDAITDSAVNARDEIGFALAVKIKELEGARDLTSVAENVLPVVERLLESPEERRLRGIRNGVGTTSVGVGLVLFAVILWGIIGVKELLIPCGAGLLVFLIGLGILVNAFFFTILPKKLGTPPQRKPRELKAPRSTTESLDLDSPRRQRSGAASVTESTTRELR